MCNILMAKKLLYKDPLFKELVQYREELSRVNDVSFWRHPENNRFILYLDSRKRHKDQTCLDVINQLLGCLYHLNDRVQERSPQVRELENGYIKPLESLRDALGLYRN